MKTVIFSFVLISTLLISCRSVSISTESSEQKNNLDYQQVDEENPLKGFAPFIRNDFKIPCSMEFFNIPLNAISSAQGNYDFSKLETNLNQISKRHHQAVFRVYLDSPSSESGIPEYFWENGIEKIFYINPDTNKSEFFPDYTNQTCIDFLTDFIKVLGTKYNGDPRIAYIFCGLIGHWGEWHNYYYTQTEGHDGDKMPTDQQQKQLYQTFSEAFSKTFTMTRFPSSSCLADFQNIGFHDDSFTEDTIDDSKSWYFMTQLKNAKMTERWKTAVIGGEFRPENQIPFIQGRKYDSYYQDYDECVEQTHCTWLIYDAAFYLGKTKAQKERVWNASKKLGYDLYCTKADFSKLSGTENEALNLIKVEITIANKGNAPFYYNWKPKLVLKSDSGILKEWENPFEDWNLTKILPDTSTTFTGIINMEGLLPEDNSFFLLTIPNPMEDGIPLKLANYSLNQKLEGYITLESFSSIPPTRSQRD